MVKKRRATHNFRGSLEDYIASDISLKNMRVIRASGGSKDERAETATIESYRTKLELNNMKNANGINLWVYKIKVIFLILCSIILGGIFLVCYSVA
ncbi:MAG: hypothetical protein KAJ91_05040 [Candidatus Aenigmarchaeota archaeon]|nr:hypothetical protein [Candidatus Aenigmarchaeota archaeon]